MFDLKYQVRAHHWDEVKEEHKQQPYFLHSLEQRETNAHKLPTCLLS